MSTKYCNLLSSSESSRLMSSVCDEEMIASSDIGTSRTDDVSSDTGPVPLESDPLIVVATHHALPGDENKDHLPRRIAQSTGSESHQYEQNESEVWWHHQLQRYLLCLPVYAVGAEFINLLL